MNAAPKKKGTVKPFQMRIDEVTVIIGRGTLVTGRIQQGAVSKGDPVEVVGPAANPRSSVVLGVQVSGRLAGSAGAGDTAGILLRGLNRGEVAPGHTLRAPLVVAGR